MGRFGGLLRDRVAAEVGFDRARAGRAVQIAFERLFEAGLAHDRGHLVAGKRLIGVLPLARVHHAHRAEHMSGGCRVVLAHSFALHLNARIVLVMLLDVGDEVHRNIVREGEGDGLAEADLTHTVIDADHRAHIVRRKTGRQTELFGHVFPHGRDEIRGGNQLCRVNPLYLVDFVAVRVIFRRGLPRLLDRALHGTEAERVAAVLDVGGKRRHAVGGCLRRVDVGRGRRNRQHIVQERVRLPGFLLGFVRIFILHRLRLLFGRRKRFAHVARDVQTGGVRLHALRKVEQLVEAVAFVLPEVGIHQNE